mgnify:FL=1
MPLDLTDDRPKKLNTRDQVLSNAVSEQGFDDPNMSPAGRSYSEIEADPRNDIALDKELARTDLKPIQRNALEEEKRNREAKKPKLDLTDDRTPQLDLTDTRSSSSFGERLKTEPDLPWEQPILDVGRMAAKLPVFVASGIGAAGAALHQGLTGGGLKGAGEAASEVFRATNDQPILESQSWLGKGVDWLFENGIKIAKEYGEAAFEEYFNTLGLSSDNALRAAGYALSQAAPEVAMMATMHKMGRGSPAEEVKPEDTAPKTTLPQVEAPKPVEAGPKQGNLFEPHETPINIFSEANKERPYKPAEDIQPDLFSDNNLIRSDVDKIKAEQKAELERQHDLWRESPEREQDAYNYIKDLPMEDVWEPSHSAPIVEKMLPPIKTRSFRDSQRGSGDMFKDLANGVYDLSQWSLAQLIRARDAYRGMKERTFQDTMDSVKVHTELAARGITGASTKREFDLGDSVRLANGKAGVIIGKTPEGYQVRFHPREGGGFDFVPSSGILYRSISGGVGKKGFKQGGAVDFFGKKEEGKKPVKTTEIVGNPLEPTGDWMTHTEVPTVDVKAKLGLESASTRSSTPYIRSLDTPREAGNSTLNHLDNKIRESMSTARRLTHANLPAFSAFYNYFGIKGYSKRTMSQRFLRTTDGFKEFQGHIKTLLDREKQQLDYPTVQEMKAMGWSSEAAAVWNSVFDVMNSTWSILDAAASINGTKPVPRIPGYIPHMFKGGYSIVLSRKVSGSPDPVHVAEFNFRTMNDLNKAMPEVQKIINADPQGKSLLIDIEKPNPQGNGTHEILEGMMRASQRMEGVKGLEALINNIYESTAKGIISHVLERQKVPKAGHLLERATEAMDTPLGLDRQGMTDAIQAFKVMTDAANDWYARSKFVNDTLFPLDQAGYLELPNLRATAMDYIANYMSMPDKKVVLDTVIKDTLIRNGLDPQMANSLARGMRSGFALFYLMGNIPFYVVNAFQSTMAPMVLLSYKAFGEARGEKTGSVSKAILHALGETPHVLTMSEKSKLVKYAEANGHVEPQFVDALTPGQIQDKITMMTERRTRQNAFNQGYYYFRQFMPEAQALASAGKFADQIGVPYSKGMGVPTALANASVVPQLFSLFASYNLHMLGLINHQIAISQAGIKTGKFNAAQKGVNSIIGLQALNTTLFGLAGMALVQNWDDLVYVANKYFGTEWKTSSEFARKMDAKLGTKGLLTHGVISQQLGYDIASSGTGPSIQAPTASLRLFEMLVGGMVLGGKWITDDAKVTKEETWNWAKGLPRPYATVAEYLIKNDHFSDVIKQAQGLEPDYSPSKDINLPGIERTKTETLIHMLSGLKSVREQDFNLSNRIFQSNEQRMQNEFNHYVQHLKEKPFFGPKEKEMLLEFAQKAGHDPDEALRAVVEYQQQKKMTPDQRVGTKADSLLGAKRYQRWQEQRALEGK